MKNKKVSMSTFIIIVGIIVIGVLACYLVVLTQKEADSSAKVEQLEKNIQDIQTQLQKVEGERNNLQDKVNSVANVIGKDDNKTTEKTEEVKNDNVSSTKNLKKFELATPVGEEGVFTVYAEEALQASGFAGASAHIYYLKNGELYYHNEGDNDTKLASGITDLKRQGEDIIAVKGDNAKIYVENQYIQYQ